MAEIIQERLEDFALSVKERPKSEFSEIGIVGCGRVGQQLAILIAHRGMNVVFIEVSEANIKQAFIEMEEELDNRIAHWGLTKSEKRAILSRIRGSTDYADLKNCDLVIETVLAKSHRQAFEYHSEVLTKIENNVSRHTIIATNSATLSITEMASVLKYPDRSVIMHVSTAARESALIEVARSIYTSDETCREVRKFAILLGKEFIRVAESAGLVTVRVFVPMINEACNILLEGVACIEKIDLAARKSLLLPMGPFELADRIGIDKLVRWLDNLYEEFGDKQFKASPILRRLDRAGYYGIKTGRGFYYYDEHGQKTGVAYTHIISLPEE